MQELGEEDVTLRTMEALIRAKVWVPATWKH